MLLDYAGKVAKTMPPFLTSLSGLELLAEAALFLHTELVMLRRLRLFLCFQVRMQENAAKKGAASSQHIIMCRINAGGRWSRTPVITV